MEVLLGLFVSSGALWMDTREHGSSIAWCFMVAFMKSQGRLATIIG